ncbi:hypothetical protein WG66_015349 [Moniliophthora roreri]|uniref:Uncharacterized protein n=1 Tax=Moniliophthora roreri TaxID=221103 RepID=A0A0W0G2C6_MONRR|nr:hypothetical protein WG66_015349 [Moniliophthora roreri]
MVVPAANFTSQIICESNTSHLTYFIAFFIISFIAVALWNHFRLFYPCLTVYELNGKERNLDNLYFNHSHALGELSLYAAEEIARKRLKSKKRASQIRMKSLELDATFSIWKIYLGVHPSVVLDIAIWYNDVQKLERQILSITESIVQYRFENQLAKPVSILSDTELDIDI